MGFDPEKEKQDDFYYYMFYFVGDTSDLFTTRNRPPCRTKAEIEVWSVKYESDNDWKILFKGGKETGGER